MHIPEELKLVNGCFRVNNGVDDYLIIWPYGFSFSTDGNGVVQINNETDHCLRFYSNIYLQAFSFTLCPLSNTHISKGNKHYALKRLY